MRRIIRKFAQNNQTHKQTNKQTEILNTEATLIPCGSSGGAGQLEVMPDRKNWNTKDQLKYQFIYYEILVTQINFMSNTITTNYPSQLFLLLS